MLETPTSKRTFHALDWHATLVERASEGLAHFIEATAEDKRAWKPTAENNARTRSCFDLAAECISVNRGSAATLRGATPTRDVPAITDMDSCKRELIASGREFAAAIREQDDSIFGKVFEMPWGPITGSVLLEISLGNLFYHAGQVNLIQILYGDEKFHVNPEFFGFVPEGV